MGGEYICRVSGFNDRSVHERVIAFRVSRVDSPEAHAVGEDEY
jgi:hypothetical protein